MNSSSPAFSKTYLHMLHTLTNMVDKAFDEVLRTHALTTLSQFMLLVAVSEHRAINQRTVAHFLGISPAAIKRQTDIAVRDGLLEATTTNQTLGQTLNLTPKGKAVIARGLQMLELHLFKIFADADRQTDLMTHIDRLLNNTKGVLREQAAMRTINKEDQL